MAGALLLAIFLGMPAQPAPAGSLAGCTVPTARNFN
eukprot:COSAG05_NODE_22824_length_262_cov_0.631902_1_plen_35_part_10